MLHKIYSIHDKKAEAYLPPFFLHSQGMAIRAFSDLVKQEKHPFHLHPEDYTLFEIGEYDDTSGRITPNESPNSLGNGVQFTGDDEMELLEDIK